LTAKPLSLLEENRLRFVWSVPPFYVQKTPLNSGFSIVTMISQSRSPSAMTASRQLIALPFFFSFQTHRYAAPLAQANCQASALSLSSGNREPQFPRHPESEGSPPRSTIGKGHSSPSLEHESFPPLHHLPKQAVFLFNRRARDRLFFCIFL